MFSAVAGGANGEAGYYYSTVYGGSNMSTNTAYDIAP
jgi:hypothetical protein